MLSDGRDFTGVLTALGYERLLRNSDAADSDRRLCLVIRRGTLRCECNRQSDKQFNCTAAPQRRMQCASCLARVSDAALGVVRQYHKVTVLQVTHAQHEYSQGTELAVSTLTWYVRWTVLTAAGLGLQLGLPWEKKHVSPTLHATLFMTTRAGFVCCKLWQSGTPCLD
jgi:hypothetical protein